MIIGNGDIASAILDHDDFTFFASGVSDSSCTDKKEFNREIELLLKQEPRRHLVYFSSFSIFYSISMYADHKSIMESLVKNHFNRYTIVRLGNIAWGSNPHTILNYLKNLIKEGKGVHIEPVKRCVIFKDEFTQIINTVIQERPREISCIGLRVSIDEMVRMIEEGKL